jgi:nondiscriminating glutamyl-tRNA synthetase
MSSQNKNVRVRFAPSPTGYLHVGGARTALYNWLYARNIGGTFVLRIEDTDQARSTQEALDMQLADLKWLGLDWDEGPGKEGLYGPYKQSERGSIYQDHAARLLSSGKAYYCFCSDETIDKKREEAMKLGKPPHYDGTCRTISLSEAKNRLAQGEKGAVRFNIGKPKDYKFTDLIRNEVTFPSDMVGDFIILRSGNMPVYNFCCVVDDALMKITHVLRAEEHLSNTLRQLMLYEAFGYEIPQFGHLSIILGPDKQKLSKRHGATSVFEYHKRGVLSEALNNFIALLGWSSPKGDEVMSMNDMTSQFTLDRFTGSAAVFDEVKLLWMNSVHLRALPSHELWARLQPFFEEAGIKLKVDQDWINRALEAFKPKMETLADAVPLFRLLSDANFTLSPEGSVMAKQSQPVIQSWIEELKNSSSLYLTEDEFNKIQEQVKIKCNVNGKNLFQPIRVAIVGVPQGIDLKSLVPLLHRDSLLLRARKSMGAVG